MKTDDIPRFTISQKIMNQMELINSLRRQCIGINKEKTGLKLRKSSMIKSINSSLSIEGNTLDLLKVKDIIKGKVVEGPFDEIIEVKDAIEAYRASRLVDPWNIDDFILIHGKMMWALVEEEGPRKTGVGIFDGDELIYKAPHQNEIYAMLQTLFSWCEDSDYSPPIIGAVAHFYIESIHPFVDGNGRMGRLWHHMVLRDYDLVFDLIPIEERVDKHQQEYYEILEKCQKMEPQDCTEFIEFCLDLNIESLSDLVHLNEPKISKLLLSMKDYPMTSYEIMKVMGMKSKPYFLKNYLNPAIGYGFVSMSNPEHPNDRNQSYRKNIL